MKKQHGGEWDRVFRKLDRVNRRVERRAGEALAAGDILYGVELLARSVVFTGLVYRVYRETLPPTVDFTA